MATTYPKAFAPTQLSVSGQTLYTAPATPTTQVLKGAIVRFTNTTTATRTITVHAVPSGSSALDSNKVCNALSVPVSDYVDIEIPILEVSDFIYAIADASTSITAQFVGGTLYTP